MDKEKVSSLKLISAFAAVYIIWGSTYLGIKFAIETIPPFLMAAFRFISAGIMLYLFAGTRSEEKLRPEHLKSTAVIGILLLLGGNGGVVWAEQYVPSGLTALLISTVPLWIVILGFFIPGTHKNSFKTTAGILLGFLGLFFLVSPENIIKGEGVDPLGAAVLIGATLSWSAGSIYTRHAVLPKSSQVSTSLEMIFGGIALLLASLISGEWGRFEITEISGRSFLSLLYLIFFGSLIAFSAYIWLLDKAGPSKATTYAYVNPVVAVILGWLLAGEELTIKILISAIIIITAVVIIITDFSGFRKT